MLVLESSPQNTNWDPMSIKALQHQALRDTRWEMAKQTGIALIHCNIDSMYYGTTLQIVPTVPPAEAILSIRPICCNPYSFFIPMSAPLLIPLQIIFFFCLTLVLVPPNPISQRLKLTFTGYSWKTIAFAHKTWCLPDVCTLYIYTL
jgi:hypothetical protein